MEDSEARRPSKVEVQFEATENSRPMTDLFGELVYEGRGQQPRKKTPARQPPTGSRNWPNPELIAVKFGPAQPYPAECLGNLGPVLEVINEKSGVGIAVAAASLIPSVALLAQSRLPNPHPGSQRSARHIHDGAGLQRRPQDHLLPARIQGAHRRR